MYYHLRNCPTRIFMLSQVLLQTEQTDVNRRTWDTHKSVVTSLSQLRKSQPRSIDLKAIKWLPYKRGQKRLLLTFEHAVIPPRLFKKNMYLANLQIFPTRVFSERTSQPLLQRSTALQDCGTCSQSNFGKPQPLIRSRVGPMSSTTSTKGLTESATM
ncbi:hypothetical protein JRQ81_016500 [Phrynocephalus forsythii]|uniref:Uncharacterized protein n=1 Tax=Phrynocephalus forsythii TaxID=171643 RepID=A0A9Q0XSC0_9SAUR|nr:hypothetical protein JRQ81_016500 [Phrynocephalus forsythii]